MSENRRKGARIRRAIPRRGAALIAAIGVLAVLTIVVMSLAVSQDYARNRTFQTDFEREVQHLALIGLDSAMRDLAAMPPGALDHPSGEGVLVPDESGRRRFSYVCRPAAADSTFGEKNRPVYGSDAISSRPGDVLVTVDASATRANRVHTLHCIYLVNAEAGRGRRLLLHESLESQPARRLEGAESD